MPESFSIEFVDSCLPDPAVEPNHELSIDDTRMATGSVVDALPVPDDADPCMSRRYQKARTLGQGGMGIVDGVYDRQTNRVVALKRTRILDEHGVASFLHEAKIQARLEHPAIVPVYDVGTDPQDNPFFTMRRLKGDTLAAILRGLRDGEEATTREWTLHARLQRFVDICLALEYAHQEGVLHRDLKPSNFMLGALGEVYVLDWGLAQEFNKEVTATKSVKPAEGSTVMGTPGYMSPELLRGTAASCQADVYALGAILFELLTLQRWHEGRSASARIESTMASDEASPCQRAPTLEIPPELDQACARATAADPRQRTQSPAALAAEIRAYLEGNRDAIRRQKLARECVDDAKQAAQRGDRKQAVAEAGRALALDPGNREAGALVASLLLEPPEELPKEVVDELAARHDEDARLAAGRSVKFYLWTLAFAPFLLLLGLKDIPIAIALVVIDLCCVAVAVVMTRRRASESQGLYWLEMALNVLFLLGLSRAGGPFILIPVSALAICMELTVQRYVGRTRLAVGIVMLAVILPFLLEELGILSQSMQIVDEGVLFIPQLVEAGGRYTLWLLLGAILFVMVTFVRLVFDLQRAKEEAQTRNAVHAWHLQQLLPEELDVSRNKA